MRRTTRISVYRQPPVWLIASVVLAAVLPAVLPAFGIETGPALPVQPVATARASEPAPAEVVHELELTAPVVARHVDASLAEASGNHEDIVIFDEADEPEEDAAQPDAALPTAPSTDDRDPRVAAPVKATRLTEAKSACRRGNKEAARSLYRDLPLGDARRKEIRKACRQEGVWIL